MQSAPFTMRADPREITTRGRFLAPAEAGVTLRGPAKWKDGVDVVLCWVQLAVCGAWKGHPAGEFSMTPATFDEICRNFSERGLPVPFDYEHASEQDATAGSVPRGGAPAQGWAHKLENRGIGGLWGLVEWLDDARDAIKAGKYAFLSPAIRFDSKDSITGRNIGARLSSIGLTNQPFLNRLEGLIAATDRAEVAPVRMSLSVLAQRLMMEKRIPYSDALNAAASLISDGVRR